MPKIIKDRKINKTFRLTTEDLNILKETSETLNLTEQLIFEEGLKMFINTMANLDTFSKSNLLRLFRRKQRFQREGLNFQYESRDHSLLLVTNKYKIQFFIGNGDDIQIRPWCFLYIFDKNVNIYQDAPLKTYDFDILESDYKKIVSIIKSYI